MSCECNTHSNINHGNTYAVSRLRKIASALGISLAEINICNTSLPDLIRMARKRAFQKPFLWAHFKSIYANVNVISALSRLANSGNSSHINKIVAMVNAGASAATVENYVNQLLESQTPKKFQETVTMMRKNNEIGHFRTIV